MSAPGTTLERTVLVYGVAPRPEYFRFWCEHCRRSETAPIGAVDMFHKCGDGSTRYLKGVRT